MDKTEIDRIEITNKQLITGRKLLVICPSRARALRAQEMLRSFAECSSCDAGLLFCIDEDDKECDAYRNVFQNQCAYLIMPRQTTTRIFNTVAVKLLPHYKYYSQTNDDFFYHTKDWDKILVEEIETLSGGWGIAYGNDLKEGKNMPTTSVISGNIVQTLGWLQMPWLTHLYGDNAWKTLGRKIGRFHYCQDVIIEHKHYHINKSELDATYKQTNSTLRYRVDRLFFELWRLTLAQLEAQKIIKAISNDNQAMITV